MIRRLSVAVAVVAVIVVVSQSFGWTRSSSVSQEEQEREVTLQQVPPPVRATILKHAGDQRIEIDEITRGNRRAYEVAWMTDGKEIEILIAADGRLLQGSADEEGEGEQAGKDDDDQDDEEGEEEEDDEKDDEEGHSGKTAEEWEHRVSRDQVPAAVLATFEGMTGGAKILGFAEESENGFTYFEGSWKDASGHHRDVLLSAAGALVEIEDGISINALPAAVLAAARMAAKGQVEFRAERKTQVLYEVKFRDADGFHEWLFGPEGRLVESSVEKGKAEDGDDEAGEEDEDDGDEGDDEGTGDGDDVIR